MWAWVAAGAGTAVALTKATGATVAAWVVLVVGWLLPFGYLLKRLTGRPPERHTPLVVVSLMGLGAIFLERVFLVFPAAHGGSRLPLAWGDLFVTAGFLALFLLSRRWFFARFKPGLISGLPTAH